MTSGRLAQRLHLKKADFTAIEDAVRSAEAGTSGEITLAATVESHDYSFYELLASVLIGALSFAILLPLQNLIHTVLTRFFWEPALWQTTAVTGALSFGITALFFLAANIPVIDRLIIPQAVRSRMVYQRALRHFVESGTYATADRTGILIFVSLMEHEVRIIADTAVSSKIPQEQWDHIAQTVAAGVKNSSLSSALIEAIGICGSLLTEHFPADHTNPNELADGLVLLEES